MAITVHAVGSAAAGTTSVTLTFPTWTFRNGDHALILIANKYPTNSPGYHNYMPTFADSQGSGGAGSAGIDTGTVYSTARLWPCRGDESGASLAAIAIASGNSAIGVIIIIRPTTEGALFDMVATNGADNSGGATSWSVTGAADPGFASGDLAVVLSAINTDLYTFGSQAMTATGATFGSMAEHLDTVTGGGQDCGIVVNSFDCSAGPSSAAPVFTMTASGSATNNPAGSSVIIRIRELSNAVTWLARAATGAAAGTTSLVLANHTGIAAGDLLIAGMGSKYVTPTTPSGYALDADAQQQGGVGTTGIDTGQIYATAFTKTADGSENSGNLTITVTAGNSCVGQIYAFRPPSGCAWALTYSKGSDDAGGAAYSATGGSDLSLAAGDTVVCVTAINSDAYQPSNFALTCSGVTFTAPAWIGDFGTANGDDCGFFATKFYVLSGTSSGNPTLAGTTVGGANAAGPTIFIRLRAIPVVTLTGTVTTAYESDIVAGGKTVILTMAGSTWVTSGGTFDGQRQNIINGMDSAQSELLGWDAVVKALQGVSGVVRTSNTVVTITLDAQATYLITANETITVTVPGTAVTLGNGAVATPTFTVTNGSPPAGGGPILGGGPLVKGALIRGGRLAA